MELKTRQRLLNEREVATSCSISVLTLRKWRSVKRGPKFIKISTVSVRATHLAKRRGW